MRLFDWVIVASYLIVPIVQLLFLRRFNTLLLENLRSEMLWFALLTAGGAVDHSLTASGLLAQSTLIHGGFAGVLLVTAAKMVHIKVKMARQLEQMEKVAKCDQMAHIAALFKANEATEGARTETRTAQAKEQDTLVRASQSKKNFMAVLLHEMRNPMQTIVAMIDALSETSLTSAQSEAVGAINESVTLMRRLADDVLDLSKMEAGKLRIEHVPFNLKRCITTSVQGWAQQAIQKKIKFDVEVDPNLPTRIILDPARLHQIVLNLVSNAFKFTRVGSVTMKVAAVSQPPQPVSDAKAPLSARAAEPASQPRMLSIAVTDTGIGVTHDEMESLFSPYSQMKLSTYREHGGTGLGLAITKQLAQALGGTITVHSEPSVGSRFTVHLPLVEDKNPEPTQLPALTIDPQLAAKHTVLLVDDNVVIRKLIGRMLTELGFTVKTAEDGVEAVDVMSTEWRNISFVFLDLTMPRMDGYAAAKRFRELGYQGPVVALTAKASADETDSVRRCGMNDILWKPVCKRDLILVICRHVQSLSASAAGLMTA